MTSPEVIATTLKGMDDRALLDRWERQMFSEEALPIARAELERRGIEIVERAPQPSQSSPDKKGGKRLVSALGYFGVVLLVSLVAGAAFGGGDRGAFGNILYGFKHPDYFLTLLAGGFGAYVAFFFGGFLIELIASFIKKRRITFHGCLLWSTALLLIAVISR